MTRFYHQTHSATPFSVSSHLGGSGWRWLLNKNHVTHATTAVWKALNPAETEMERWTTSEFDVQRGRMAWQHRWEDCRPEEEGRKIKLQPLSPIPSLRWVWNWRWKKGTTGLFYYVFLSFRLENDAPACSRSAPAICWTMVPMLTPLPHRVGVYHTNDDDDDGKASISPWGKLTFSPPFDFVFWWSGSTPTCPFCAGGKKAQLFFQLLTTLPKPAPSFRGTISHPPIRPRAHKYSRAQFCLRGDRALTL